MPPEPLYPELRLSDGLVRDLRRMNPWWEGSAAPRLPDTRRHLVAQIQSRLDKQLAPIVVVRGPRQIGKTTAQLQVLSDLFAAGIQGRRVLRVQFDDLEEIRRLSEPILRIVDWYEQTVLRCTLNDAAARDEPTYLFFDEVQDVEGWAPQLKSLVDASTTQVVVTGSSALRIELGRDSLAGRISTIEAGVLSLTEIGAFRSIDLGRPFLEDNGLEPLTDLSFWRDLAAHGRALKEPRDRVFRRFSERGGYPLAQRTDADWGALADQLNENVIRRVIQHDLRLGERGRRRDPELLEELFRLSCRYVGQAPTRSTLAREANRALGASVGEQRVGHYLRFLGDSLLLRLIPPLEIRLKRAASGPKICLADHGLRASWLQEVVPLDAAELARDPALTTLAGRIAESVFGAAACTMQGLDVAYVPARGGDPEVDFVFTIGTRRVPVEIKYQRRLDALTDTEGLRAFLEKTANNSPCGLLITQTDTELATDPRIVTLPLSSFLLLR